MNDESYNPKHAKPYYGETNSSEVIFDEDGRVSRINKLHEYEPRHAKE
jgi:hypothetical protein